MSNPVVITIEGQALLQQIHTEFEKLGAKVDSFGQKVKQSKAAPSELGAAFASLGSKVTAMFASFVAIGTLKHFSDEALRSARQMAQLEAALASAGKASEQFRQQLAAEREELSKKIGVDDDAVVAVQRQLVQYGAAKEQIKELTELTFDLATAQGIDATTAAMEMGRALAGQDVQMRGVRLEIDRTLPKVDQVAQMMDRLNQKFGGQAKAAFEAAAPELTRFQNQLGETAKAIGENINQWSELLKPMTKALEVLEKINKAAVGDKVAPSGAINSTAAGGMIAPINQQVMRKFLASQGQGDDLFNRRLKMLSEQQATDLAGAQVPVAGAEADRDMAILESQFSRGEVKLRDYLRRRQEIIKESMVAEQQFITTTASMLTNLIALKEAEVNQLATQAETDPSKQEDLIRAKTELAKLQLDLAKASASQKVLNARGVKTDQEGQDFARENPTSMGGAFALVHSHYADEWANRWKTAAGVMETAINGAISNISHGITGLIEGTTTWSEVLKNIGENLLSVIIEAIVRMFAAWILGQETATAAKVAGDAASTASELAKQAATIPGKIVEMLATAVGEGGWGAVAIIAAAVAAVGVGVAAAAGAFAEGGRPPVGEVALVGERGPELFVPDTSGTIVPAHVTSNILNGSRASSSRQSSRSGKQEGVQLQVHVWGDDAVRMQKHINQHSGVQHAVLDLYGKNQHLLTRTS